MGPKAQSGMERTGRMGGKPVWPCGGSRHELWARGSGPAEQPDWTRASVRRHANHRSQISFRDAHMRLADGLGRRLSHSILSV